MITVHKHVERIYKKYWGETTIAVVVRGVCVSSHVNGHTGGVWLSRSPGHDPCKGLSVAALKRNGFQYNHFNNVYTDDSGARYHQDDSGVWLVEDIEAGGDYPVYDKVVVA